MIGTKSDRFWCNDDTDKGDYIGQWRDATPNAANLKVDGKLDLVNFFPVQVDVSAFRQAWGNNASFKIRAPCSSGLWHCTIVNGLSSDATNALQTEPQAVAGGAAIDSADLVDLDWTGLDLGDGLRPDGTAMLAFEATRPAQADDGPELVVSLGGVEVFAYRLAANITHVCEMYNWINSRHLSDGTETRQTWLGAPSCGSGKSFVFLHGANVSETDAGKWGDAIFKRLWWAGADVDFYNVDWRSDIGSSANYHENASNAFAVAQQLVSTITAIPGRKTVMAHSLGNMVVSSMIQDYGLLVERYLMCNSAVPAEAYDPDPSLRVPQLVHPDWEEYPTNTWTASYHSLFDGFADDDVFVGVFDRRGG